MQRVILVSGLILGALPISGCSVYENPATPYVQRTDAVTLGAGNAQAANAAQQVIDPWPPEASYRRIPGNGVRAAGAVERYERAGTQPSRGGATAAPGGGATAGAAALTPVPAVSGEAAGGRSSY